MTIAEFVRILWAHRWAELATVSAIVIVGMLGRPAFAQLLQTLGRNFSVVILYAPAASDYADARTIAFRARGALMIGPQHNSHLFRLSALARTLREFDTTIGGSVINEG